MFMSGISNVGSVVNMLNQRAQQQNTSVQKQQMQTVLAMQRAVSATGNYLDTYEGSYASKMNMAENRVSRLQSYIDALDLQMYYEEQLTNEDLDSATRRQYETSLDLMKTATSQENLQENLSRRWLSLSSPSAYINSAVNKATGDIRADLSSLEYLGLSDYGNMSAQQKKDALINAMKIGVERLHEAGYASDVRFEQKSIDELLPMSGKLFNSLVINKTCKVSNPDGEIRIVGEPQKISSIAQGEGIVFHTAKAYDADGRKSLEPERKGQYVSRQI